MPLSFGLEINTERIYNLDIKTNQKTLSKQFYLSQKGIYKDRLNCNCFYNRKLKGKGSFTMEIIIVGCGKVGYTLVEQLNGENHNIVVIDENEAKVNDITMELDAKGVVGNGVSYQVLQEAGITKADLLIAVTGSDEQNLLCCIIAKKTGNCKTIARVRNPIYNTEIEFLKEELGLAMIINPELTSAAEIARIFQFPSAVKVDTFSKGLVELLHFRVTKDCLLNNYKLINIHSVLKCDVLQCIFVCCINILKKPFL